MLPYALYLLKVSICSGILFGYYRLVLRNKIFHQYNRFYLLATVVVSLALPLIQVNIWHSGEQSPTQAIQLLQAVGSSNEYLDEIVLSSKPGNISIEQALSLFYLIITLVLFIFFLQSLSRIQHLYKNNRHRLVENVYFVNTTAKGTPFSFLSYIFWNDQIDPESVTGMQIFKHELAHVQQKHSYDKLFINVTLLFSWCNPFFWIIRRELNMIHEFMADQIALEDSDTEAFAAMILQATYPQHRFQLTNPFFYSPIKRRLLMLTKNRNPRVGYIGRVFALPLALFIFAAFTLKTNTIKNTYTPGYTGNKISIVLDAGHGGADKGGQSLTGNILEKDLTLAIIKKIKELNSNPKINIILTRETDLYQSVKEKVAFTKAQNADLFISIHMDAASVDSAVEKSGMRVLVAKDNFANSANSKLFASAIIHEFAVGYDLPVAPFPQQPEMSARVLLESPCPSVIIEAGYITNSMDLSYLQANETQEIIAEKILAAVERYALAKEKAVAGEYLQSTAINYKKNIIKKDTLPEITLKNYDKALIIADGKKISKDELKRIKPETIESISVLRDKSGTAVYGEKGKHGVVLLTTKEKGIVFNNLTIISVSDSTKDTATISGNIKIRGNATLEKQPLYVIDGIVQTGKMDINTISPNDIESINVIKGKIAVDKYGEPGTNGVVEISTKSKKALKTTTLSVTPGINKSNGMSAVKIPPPYINEGQPQQK